MNENDKLIIKQVVDSYKAKFNLKEDSTPIPFIMRACMHKIEDKTKKNEVLVFFYIMKLIESDITKKEHRRGIEIGLFLEKWDKYYTYCVLPSLKNADKRVIEFNIYMGKVFACEEINKYISNNLCAMTECDLEINNKRLHGHIKGLEGSFELVMWYKKNGYLNYKIK